MSYASREKTTRLTSRRKRRRTSEGRDSRWLVPPLRLRCLVQHLLFLVELDERPHHFCSARAASSNSACARRTRAGSAPAGSGKFAAVASAGSSASEPCAAALFSGTTPAPAALLGAERLRRPLAPRTPCTRASPHPRSGGSAVLIRRQRAKPELVLAVPHLQPGDHLRDRRWLAVRPRGDRPLLERAVVQFRLVRRREHVRSVRVRGEDARLGPRLGVASSPRPASPCACGTCSAPPPRRRVPAARATPPPRSRAGP